MNCVKYLLRLKYETGEWIVYCDICDSYGDVEVSIFVFWVVSLVEVLVDISLSEEYNC